MSVHGIHHVTAVTADIVGNLEFYTGPLGMRLVKKSVNQDDVSAYHLFYADAVGSPGTDLTFFDWPKIGSASAGSATVSLTTLRVSGDALDAWEARLAEHNVFVERDEDARGRARLTFADPEGQRLALVDDTNLPLDATPFTGVVSESQAIRGILGVSLESARPDATMRVLTDLLGFAEAKGGETPVFEARGANSVGEVAVIAPTSSRPGRVGAGGVHHVAFRVRDDEHLNEIRERVEAAGLHTSGEIDRFWFHSVYFREPGGVLFELATDGPGFGVDEDMSHLGEATVLAPFLEPQRDSIVAALKPLPLPVYLRK